MKKVAEYLDSILDRADHFSCEMKENGHYCVHGHWGYSKPRTLVVNKSGIGAPLGDGYWLDFRDYLGVSINNETIYFRIWIKDTKALFSFLQTYEHIPRGEVDTNGYYARSTEEEVIKYIDHYYKRMIELN